MDQDQCLSWPQHSMSHLHASQAALLPVASCQCPNLSEDGSHIGVMKEMMYKIAAMQPVDMDPATIQKPQRKNVRFSTDPQSVAARLRRERVSEKIRILRRMVPGGSKMDTASMLDEAILYVKFLKKLVGELQSIHPYTSCQNVDMETSDDWSTLPMSNMIFTTRTAVASSSVSSTGPALASSSLGNFFSSTDQLGENYVAHGVR